LLIPKIERWSGRSAASSPSTYLPGSHHRDNVTVQGQRLAYFRVVEPTRAIVSVVITARHLTDVPDPACGVSSASPISTPCSPAATRSLPAPTPHIEQTERGHQSHVCRSARRRAARDHAAAMARQAEASAEARQAHPRAGASSPPPSACRGRPHHRAEEGGLQLAYLQTLGQIANDRAAPSLPAAHRRDARPDPLDDTTDWPATPTVAPAPAPAPVTERPTPRRPPPPGLDTRP